MPASNNLGNSIRGDKGQVRVLENGGLVGVYEFTGFSANEDQSVLKSYYVGQTEPEIDKSVMGYSGSFTIEVKNDTMERLIFRQNEAIKNNNNRPNISIVVVKEYGGNGASPSSTLYKQCVLNLENENFANLSEKSTIGISFTARNKEFL